MLTAANRYFNLLLFIAVVQKLRKILFIYSCVVF